MSKETSRKAEEIISKMKLPKNIPKNRYEYKTIQNNYKNKEQQFGEYITVIYKLTADNKTRNFS